MRFFLRICCTAIVVCLIPVFVHNTIRADASDPVHEVASAAPTTEPSAARVGRLSLVSADVELRGVGEASWANAARNQPVIAGQAVRTGRSARGEIEIGADTIDLSGETEVEITRLSDQLVQLVLSHGRVGLTLRRLSDGETVQIDFPQGAVRLLGPGRYDIGSRSENLALQVTVFEGAARLAGGSAETQVEAGQMAVLTGSDPVLAHTARATADDFVAWCRARDYDETRLATPYYVSPYMTGFAELDSAGVWKINSDYGPVWFPADAEWSPYRFGHWGWMAPWGWNWIDDQPWAFAPSHYGRWARIDDRWAWVPGGFVAHPLFMPAAVAFLGTPGIGLSSEDGATVAWFPLAPGEAYWPAYTRDVEFVRSMNTGDVRDVGTIGMLSDGEPPLELFHTHFANRQFTSVVPRSVFATGRAVASALLTLPEQRLQDAPVLMASPQIAPPSAQPVARGAPPVAKPAATRAAFRTLRTGDAKIIRVASVRPRGRAQPVLLRGAHLRVPSYAGQIHGRRLIVLRVAHSPHGAAGRRARH